VNRNVWLLFACQALMSAVMAGQVVMASLVGHALAVDKALNTLPMGIQMVGVMAASIPAGIVFARLGRRPGFWLGCVLSILGSLTFALAVWRGDFPLYCFAALLAGLGFGISQHLRFAAAEVAAPEARARAISLVLAGGVVAAVIGPEIVKDTNSLITTRFLATYLTLPVLPTLTAILLLFVRVSPPPERQRVAVPFRAIVARPSFITAVVAAVVGYGTMNLVMASTPLQMMLCGFGVNASADVIRAHSIAMFLPGFVTGRIIQRFGVHQVICAGALITALCCAVNLTFAPVMGTFLGALTLLGIGWNFMFVGGTTLLGTAYEPHERVRVQATNDFIVFGTVALTAFGSGAIHALFGWDVLNLSVLPPVVIAIALVSWHWLARERRATAAV
jgi:MFS family permease